MKRQKLKQTDGLTAEDIDVEYWQRQLAINKDNLDDEVVKHPELFGHVATTAARMESVRDQLKDDLKRVDADLSLDLRDKGTGEKRKTEGAIQAEIESHPDHLDARTRYTKAVRMTALWQALKESFVQRSYMLKSLTELVSSGYSSSTSHRGDPQDYERTREELAEKRRKRRV